MRFYCRRFLRALARSLELTQPSGVRRVRLSLDLAVLIDQSRAKRCQNGATTMASTHLRSDNRLAKAIVHVVDQKPRATVRHAERDTGFGDRPSVTDRFQ